MKVGLLFLLLTLISCVNEIDLKTNTAGISSAPAPTAAQVQLVWSTPSPTLRAGETIPFSFLNGATTFTTDANGIGVFDPITLEYTPPLNQPPLRHEISASDETGRAGTNSVSIINFREGQKIGFPLSFGDQNFPTGVAQTTNGNLYIASIVGDSPGWERWVVFRSTDNGETFSKVDHFIEYEEGETHPLGAVANGNDVYVCGYGWSFGGTAGVEWIVRKSSDNGTTWDFADRLVSPTAMADYICYDMAVSPAGHLYAVGEDTSSGGIVRESLDGGTTWTTIYTGGAPGTRFTEIEFSPLGVMWVKDTLQNMHRGTFGGSWNFTVQGTGSGSSQGTYELRSSFKLISETELILTGQLAGKLIIQRSTDSGASWTTTYTSIPNSSNHGIAKLPGGELILPTVNIAGFNRSMFILKSIDNGQNWTQVYNDNTNGRAGNNVIAMSDGSVRVIANEWQNPNQIVNLKSLDNGDTWQESDRIIYREKLYHWLSEIKRDGLGNIWASAYVGIVDDNDRDAWAVVKSADNGLTWSETDVFSDPARDLFANCIAVTPTNEVYVGETYSGTNLIRKTSDQGASWSTVETSAFGCTKMASGLNGDVFYYGSGFNHIRRGVAAGATWESGAAVFPLEVGSTGFTPLDITVLADGSLWLALNETNGGTNHVLYRSTDGGDTFNQVYREPTAPSTQSIKERGAVLYAIFNQGLKRSSDGGATWLLVYDNVSYGNIQDYSFDSSGRLYVMTTNNTILAQNQFTGTFFAMYDYTALNTLSGASIESFTDCGSPSGICAVAHYDISIEGSVWQFLPLSSPL